MTVSKSCITGKLKVPTDILQGIVTKNSKDAKAIYWFGQTMIANDDVAGAKALYQKALNDGINDAFILVGMGHVELLEGGDVNSAKQKFEQAITQSKDKKGRENADILNAIGRANADGSIKIGDPMYAVEKLKKAAGMDPKNPDIFINMGINYLKWVAIKVAMLFSCIPGSYQSCSAKSRCLCPYRAAFIKARTTWKP